MSAISRAQLESRLDLLEAMIEGEEPMIETTVVQASLANPEVTYLRQQLYSLYSRRLDFAGLPGETLTEREARLQALEASIAEMKAKLEAEPMFLEPVETVQVAPNTRYASIRARMDAAREELAGLMAGSVLEIAEREKLRTELSRLTKFEPRIRELERESEALRREFDQLEQTSERYAMISELDQDNMSNLVPLRVATLPMGKSGPNRSKYLMLGVMLGLCSGLGLVFLLEANQPRIISPGDALHVFEGDEDLALETVPPSGPRKREGKGESAPTDWA
jgi:uncharacterized protein involved in exopolysaccharide biosynthesis